MKHITILHARLLNHGNPTIGVRLHLQVPLTHIEQARKLIKEQYQADAVHLTYREHQNTAQL